jgi:hypothetical protein
LRRQRAKGLHIAREPEGQQCFEAFGTGEIGCSPDSAERFKQKVWLVERSSPSFVGLRLGEAFKSPEHSDGMFAVKPTGSTEFVEDDGFLFSGSFLITQKDRFHVFFFRSWAHNPGSFPPSISGNIYYESTIPFYSDTR